jgi:hypothetical protein
VIGVSYSASMNGDHYKVWSAQTPDVDELTVTIVRYRGHGDTQVAERLEIVGGAERWTYYNAFEQLPPTLRIPGWLKEAFIKAVT